MSTLKLDDSVFTSSTNPTLQQDSKTKEDADISGGSAPTSTPNVVLGSSTKSTTGNGESTGADPRSPALALGSKTEPFSYSAAAASSLKDETIHPALTDALEKARGESLRRSILCCFVFIKFMQADFRVSPFPLLVHDHSQAQLVPAPPQQHGLRIIPCSSEHPEAGVGRRSTHNLSNTAEFVSSFADMYQHTITDT